MLVEFAVPFYCGTLIQTSQLEEATVLKGKNIKLAKVDCDQEAELCQRNDIQHYPCVG
jgi:protein disulfide-isomerase A1